MKKEYTDKTDTMENIYDRETETRTSAKKTAKGKNKGTSVLLILLIIIAACVFCLAGYKLIDIYLRYHTSSVSYDDVRKAVQEDGTNAYAATDPAASDYEPDSALGLKFEYEDEYDEGMTYNYEALLAINPDVIGYIKARGDGAIVDYPIVQTDDNDYYIDHMFDRTYNAAGSIFMDCAAEKRFSSSLCIIYGHNMASGSRMFGYLKQYEKEDYHNSHLEYDIFTPYEHYVYRVVAAYKTDTSDQAYTSELLYNENYMTDEERLTSMKELAEHAIASAAFKTGFDVNELTSDSHLIALSTCYGGYDSPSRFIVLLVRDRIVIPRETS